MKRFLLFASFTALGVAAMNADMVKELPNCAFTQMSPNGRWLVSDYQGSLRIYDREANVNFDFVTDDADGSYYTTGLGNAVSNNGIVIMSTKYDNDARYWENGELHELDTTGSTGAINFANAITPDGSRICGRIAAHDLSTDGDFLMGVPVYWDRLADGTYSECKKLPYPTVDFSYRVPQYVTAVSISEDGKTIVGQVRDCSGFVHQPIVYNQTEDGEWTYKLLFNSTFQPEGYQWPEYPGYGPECPQKSDFMSEEQRALYDEDLAAYYATWEGDCPVEENYMTEEEIAAYNAAEAEWTVAFMAWQEKSDAFYAVWNEVVASLPSFVFNSAFVTPNGEKYVANREIPGDDMEFSAPTYEPWVIDIAKDEVIAKYEGGDYSICQVPNNDTVMAWSGMGTYPCTGYVLANGKATPMHEYISAQGPALKTWVDETLTRKVEQYNYETGTVDLVDMIYTGLSLASADMSVVAFSSASDWDYDYLTWAYIVDFNAANGVKTTMTDAQHLLQLGANGTVALAAGVTSATFYTAAGVAVLTLDATASSTLPAGIYMVRATLSDGTVTTSKVKF